MLAECLRPNYPRARITPREDGTGLEFSVGAKLDSKKTDVGVWDDAAGLIGPALQPVQIAVGKLELAEPDAG